MKHLLSFLPALLLLAVSPLQAQHSCDIDRCLQQGQDATARGGLGCLRMADGKLLFEIPLKYLGRECLISSCIARTTHYQWMEVGSHTQVTHARLTSEGGNIYLKKIDTSVEGNRADTASCRSIGDNHIDSYLAKLPLVDKTSESVTVDVTELFTTDRTFSPLPWYFNKVSATLDRDLCRVMACKVFDDNLSVRTLYTFRYPGKGNIRAGVCSAEVVHSLLLLPDEKMRPRLADARMGLFTERKKRLDFTQSDFYRPIAYAQRWRVEPSDWDAWKRGETVKPVKPIVYYLDNEFPERWKEPLRKGILKWNEAFTKFGLKEVIAVRDYPTPAEDPDFDEDNLKYSCIRYVATDRGAAQGPSWSDPTTGELLCASVYVWATLPEIMNRYCFVQTAHANPAIRSGRLSDEELSIALQSIITHEIGHTLGMAHNMGGSAAYPVDSLLNADFVRRNGLTASVMDYIYYNYIVPPGETDVPLSSTNLGAYDELCLSYIYRPTDPALSVEEDARIAEGWLDAHAGDPRYRYGIQQWGNRYDPTSLTYDISDDPLRAGELSIRNLHYVLEHLGEWLAGGENLMQRREMYLELTQHYTRLLEHVLCNVGGIRLNFVKEGTPGETYRSIPSDLQRRSLQWVADELHRSAWVDDRELTSKFAPAVDASAEIQAKLAAKLVGAAENVVLSAHLSTDTPYTVQAYTDGLYELFFAVPARQKQLTQADKTLQRALLKEVLEAISQETKQHAAPWLDDTAATSFAFQGDSGYLDNIPVGLIGEQKACFLLLVQRIRELAATRMKSATETDRAHWTLLEYATAQPASSQR